MRMRLATIGMAAIGFALGGCSRDDDRILAPEPAPAADSPAAAVRRLEWAYRNRSIEVYRELFTADYRFVFSALDSNGNAYRDRPFTRDDDIESTTHLFQGGHASEPAAAEIRLDLDRNFNVFADPRPVPPYRDPRWHRSIRTTFSLNLVTRDGDVTTVQGFANFFLVRGDSANVPVELGGRGGAAATWFIERWEDESACGGALPATPAPASPQPASCTSWGSLKARYR